MSGRSIAPRPASQQPDSASTAARHSPNPPVGIDAPQLSASQTQTLNTAHASASVSTRKKVTSACQGCQKRRVKCDGHLPCASCVKTRSECTYTRELDGRSIKRKYHEVQRDQDLLHDLLTTIRSTNDEHVSQIVSLIRSDASMDDVKACMTQQLLEIRLAGRERSPEFQQLQASFNTLRSEAGDRVRTVQRTDVLGIQRLADRPLYKVPAAPWTTVTDDDDLVSNLVSSFLIWDKGWHDWIEQDLFTRDMQSGSLDAMFCSPFLANCLLAWGCTYSDFREARSSNGAVSPLMEQFMAEAKRLLETENTNGMTLTTVQGLMVLHASLAVSGRDQYGYRFMLQAIGMMSDLLSSPIATKAHPDPQVAKELSRAISRTSWGVYIITTQTFATLLKPQMMKPPKRPRDHRRSDGDTGQWRPYPHSDESIPSYRDELFMWGCDLAIIEAELSQILFNTEEQPPRAELETKMISLYERLQQGVVMLPRHLRYEVGSCPSLFMHALRIQVTVLRIFLPLRESTHDADPAIVALARKRCLQASLQSAETCRVFIESWGATHIGVLACQPGTIALSVLVEESDTLTYSRQITDLCVMMRAQSRRWPICMGMLRMIQLDARTRGSKLPAETDKLFEEFEDSAWRQREVRKYATLYPMAETSKSANLTGDDMDMGRFLEAMDRLELEDPAVDPDQETP